MKRERAERAEESMGATELSSLLSGDDPTLILDGLRRFVRIVNEERNLALELGEEEAIEDDEDDAQVTSQQSKRLKSEEKWKEDTASYNVPFVGTSVSVKDKGKIVKNQWPTGLLMAFLDRSPQATELISDHLVPGVGNVSKTLVRHKQHKLNELVGKAYCRALSELISSEIPISKLRDEMTIESNEIEINSSSIVSLVLKKRLGTLFDILKSETGDGKGLSGLDGGCGPLAVEALNVLTKLSLTSTTTARHIARSMEQKLPELVQRFLVRMPHKPSVKITSRDKARAAVFRFVSVLMAHSDPVILNCIVASGFHERKGPPGILYLICRDGFSLSKDLLSNPKTMFAPKLSLILKMIVQILMGPNEVVSRKTLLDLISKDFVDGIVNLAAFYPFPEDFDTIGDFERMHETEMDPLRLVCRSAQATITRFLLDKTSSPLLVGLGFQNASSSKHSMYLVVRLFNALLNQSARSLSTQRFIIHCTNGTPHVLGPFFKSVSLPVLKENEYNVVSRLHFFSRALQNGPKLLDCTAQKAYESSDSLADSIAPIAIRKLVMSNLLRGKNHLILSEVLRVCLCILKRVHAFGLTDDVVAVDMERVTKRLKQHLPDLQVVVSLANSFGSETKHKNRVIFARALEVLRISATVIPAWFNEAAFDCAKILPDPSKVLSFPSLLQHKILDTVSEIFLLLKESLGRSHQVVGILFDLLVKTRLKAIHLKCRRILVSILSERFIKTGWSSSIMRHEASCWVDCMNEFCIQEFLDLLKITSSVPDIMLWVECTKVWDQAGFKTPSSPQISAFMVEALKRFNKSSSNFQALTVQVASRSILFHTKPQATALLLVHWLEESNEEKATNREALENLSQSIIDEAVIDNETFEKFLQSWSVAGSFFSTLLEKQEVTSSPNGAIEMDDFGFALQYLSNMTQWRGADPSFLNCVRKLAPALNLSKKGYSWDAKPFLSLTMQRMAQLRPKEAQAIFLTLSYCGEDIQAGYGFIIFEEEEVAKTLLDYLLLPSMDLDATIDNLSKVLGGASYRAYKEISQLPLLSNLLDHFANLYMKSAGGKSVEIFTSLVDLWKDPSVTTNSPLLLSCQNALSKVLGGGLLTRNSFMLLKYLEEMDAEEVISRALEVEISRKGRSSSECFPQRLLKQDYILYCSAFFSGWVKGGSQFEVNESNGSVVLQTCLSAFQRWENLKMENSAREAIVERIAMVVTKCNAGSCKEQLMDIAIDVILCLKCEHLASLEVSLFQLLRRQAQDFLEQIDDFAPDTRVKVLKHSLQVLSASGLRDSEESSYQLAQDIIFLQAFMSCLERFLRSCKEAANPSRIKRVRDLQDIFHTYWHQSQGMGCPTSEGKFSIFMLLMKSCVKYGLGGSTLASSLSCGCLELVLLILPSIAQYSLNISSTRSICSTLFQWVTSHSSFSSLTTEDSPSAKTLVMRILVFCLKNASDIPFEIDVWSSVLAGYGAGLCESDILSRTFLFEYQAIAPHDVEICRMDKMRWGSEAGSQVVDDPWDWLCSWIETQRVILTLRNFPLGETDEPSEPLQWLERCKTELSNEEQKRCRSKDKRYSPGFLLPIIASALEQRLSSQKSQTGAPSAKPQFVQKLAQRGAIALALASLCSHCATIRKLAMAILHFALIIIDSDEAKNLSSWRERPQLSLLLRSIQRALAFSEEPTENTAIVDPPCAIFTAKASILLSNPGDEIYPSINRYFLRIGENHGATNDLRRQPAFVSLFCSSNTDEVTATRERCWAVETLRDSFIHEKCFGPFMSCHALEMLLTRVETIEDSRHDVEFDLIISAITRIVKKCGERGANELLKRAGILSWLTSQIDGRRILDRYEKPSLFVELVCEVMKLDGVEGMHDILVSLKGVPEILIRTLINSTVKRQFSFDAVTEFFNIHHSLLTKAGNNIAFKAEISTRFLEALLRREVEPKYLSIIVRYLANIQFTVEGDCMKLICLFLEILEKAEVPSEEMCSTVIQCTMALLPSAKCYSSDTTELSDRLLSLRPLCSSWTKSRSQWEQLYLSMIPV